MKLLPSKILDIYSPVEGKVTSLDNVDDDVFRNRMLGDGVAVLPTSEKIFAPCDGEINYVAKSLHSIIIKAKHKTFFMIHIGLNTVYLKGEGFKCFVSKGQKVKRGHLIAEVDLKKIKSKGMQTITPIILIEKKAEIIVTEEKIVNTQDILFKVKL